MQAVLRSCAAVALAGALVAGGARAQDDGAPGEVARPLDARALRALALDLLGRPPLPEERAAWLGLPLGELADELVGGPEFWRHWYEEQLDHFLLIDNFRPVGPGLEAIPEELERSVLDVRAALHRIALSSSFDQRNPGADTFVTVVMEQLGGMTVQSNARELEIGKAVYDGAPGTFLGRRGETQADVVRNAVEHERFARTFVEREHRRLLHADPAPRDLAAWSRELHRDPTIYADLVREWLLSPAWSARVERRHPLPNRLFVRALFVDLCGRLPDPDEARRLRIALDGLSDPGPLRAVLARLLLDSGAAQVPAREEVEDPTAWLRELFPRLLGRAPSEAELAEFAAAFHDPACRPATAVYALVSHPEYQTY